MFKRSHHQKVVQVLSEMNHDFLRDAKCYFGGGTAISLLLGEYRESVDIDFLCADQEGYRKLRSSVFDKDLGEIFSGKVEIMRDVRSDRDGIRTILSVDGTPIKFEIIREARIELAGTVMPNIPVLCLTKEDLFAEKLLANADRFADKSAMSRDLIDLMVMEAHWGAIPKQAWDKATDAYGDSVDGALRKAKELLRSNPEYLARCLKTMGIDDEVATELRCALGLECDNSQGFCQ